MSFDEFATEFPLRRKLYVWMNMDDSLEEATSGMVV